jgi:hypothetical protein
MTRKKKRKNVTQREEKKKKNIQEIHAGERCAGGLLYCTEPQMYDIYTYSRPCPLLSFPFLVFFFFFEHRRLQKNPLQASKIKTKRIVPKG